tara:strand:+ start:3767 stop:5134 length:1368 start_codon:yes stop_codon:yes gene_type:complete
MTIKDNNEIRNLFVNKKYKEIIDISSIKGNFDDALSINILSLSYLNIGNYEKSISILKEAISKYGEDISLLNNLGNAYRIVGLLDNAIEAFEQAININSNSYETYNNLGLAHKDKKNLRKASEYFKKAVAINSKSYQSYYNLGLIERSLGNKVDAEEFFKKAINIEAGYDSAIESLANLYKENKEYVKAISYYKKTKSKHKYGQVLECLFALQDLERFSFELNEIIKIDRLNIRVAAITNYVSQQTGINNIYPFCRDPLGYIYQRNLLINLDNEDISLNQISNEANKLEHIWEPNGSSVKKGYRTIGFNLFDGQEKSHLLNKVKNLMENEIENYLDEFSNKKDLIIKKFPKSYNLVGWHVRLSSGGNQSSHIHPDGWLSGIFYLKIPSNTKENEGKLKLSIHGYNYKIINENIAEKIISPNEGDIVIIPSSLFHQAIAYYSDENRECIAFDVIPN